MNMDTVKKKIVKILDYFWDNLTHFLIAMFSIALLFLFFSYWVDDTKISAILKDIGTVIIAGAIFQFILKSRGFIKVVDETLDHTKRQWEKYNFQYINKLLLSIKKAHSSFEYNFNHTMYESIRKAREDYIEMTNKVKSNTSALRTNEDEALLRRNFYIREITNIRTIYKNGCEIVTITADIEIVKDGLFCFIYNIYSSNPENIFPEFEYYKNNTADKRFSDYSFSAKVLDLPDNLKHTRLNITPLVDENKHKKLEFTLSNVLFEGTRFKLLFSITTKDEYNLELLTGNKMQAPSSTSKYPIGVRRYIIQEEHYGNTEEENRYLFSPSISSEKGNLKDDSGDVSENLFYRIHTWVIYYSKIDDSTVTLSLTS